VPDVRRRTSRPYPTCREIYRPDPGVKSCSHAVMQSYGGAFAYSEQIPQSWSLLIPPKPLLERTDCFGVTDGDGDEERSRPGDRARGVGRLTSLSPVFDSVAFGVDRPYPFIAAGISGSQTLLADLLTLNPSMSP
jgi:hypothetical protein